MDDALYVNDPNSGNTSLDAMTRLDGTARCVRGVIVYAVECGRGGRDSRIGTLGESCVKLELVFKIAIPLLPYKQPKILQSVSDAARAMKGLRVKRAFIVIYTTLFLLQTVLREYAAKP